LFVFKYIVFISVSMQKPPGCHFFRSNRRHFLPE